MRQNQCSTSYPGITADRILSKVKSCLGTFGLQNLLIALSSETVNNWIISETYKLSLCEVRVLRTSLDACLRASFEVQKDLRKMLVESVKQGNGFTPIIRLRA